MRKLASIQTIADLEPIPGADQIVKATVLGWNVVVKKGEFSIGDPCVYFEIDSLLPVTDAFSFLARSGVKKILIADNTWAEGYRLHTVKLKGQVSQGLALPITLFAHLLPKDLKKGQDVTKELGVVKYEVYEPEPVFQKASRKPVIFPSWLPKGAGMFVKHHFPTLAIAMWGVNLKHFPEFIPKTDETRIQAVPGVLTRHNDKLFYVTEKLDGSSITVFYKDGLFGVCSRTILLPEDPNNKYWKAALALELDKKMPEWAKWYGNFALQGELVGEGIQGNKYNIKGQKIFFYQAYNIDRRCYLNNFTGLRTLFNLPTVPILTHHFTLENKSVDDLVELSKGKSQLASVKREGIVIRPHMESADPELGRLSLKVINPDFLLEHKE